MTAALLLLTLAVDPAPPVLDVPYAGERGHARQRLDIYPAGSDSSPVLLIVHGGGWSRGAKERMRPVAEAYARSGVTAVAVGYRLSPEVKHPAHTEDVAAAVAWTFKNIQSHGGDPKRVSILGHSAGAHLVALVGTDPSYLAKHGSEPSDLKWVVPVDTAAFDLTATGAAVSRLSAVAFGTDPEDLRAASPLTHVETGRRYPSFLVPYVAERVGSSAAQSVRLVEALKGVGAEAVAMPVPDKTHASIMRGQADPNDVVAKAVLERVLAP